MIHIGRNHHDGRKQNLWEPLLLETERDVTPVPSADHVVDDASNGKDEIFGNLFWKTSYGNRLARERVVLLPLGVNIFDLDPVLAI
eukprot:scaffold1703_cov76-Cylindrotheca_fusiformis.AAC.5